MLSFSNYSREKKRAHLLFFLSSSVFFSSLLARFELSEARRKKFCLFIFFSFVFFFMVQRARVGWRVSMSSLLLPSVALLAFLVVSSSFSSSSSSSSFAAATKTSSSSLPRGVRPSRAKFYSFGDDASSSSPSGDLFFRCLDGSGELLPRSRINDDYCDCVDGSDEPGKEMERVGRKKEKDECHWITRKRKKKSIEIDWPHLFSFDLLCHSHTNTHFFLSLLSSLFFRQGPPPAPTASSTAPTWDPCRN